MIDLRIRTHTHILVQPWFHIAVGGRHLQAYVLRASPESLQSSCPQSPEVPTAAVTEGASRMGASHASPHIQGGLAEEPVST